MAESQESLCDKIVKCKSGMEVKGLKMNVKKTEIMFDCDKVGRVQRQMAVLDVQEKSC